MVEAQLENVLVGSFDELTDGAVKLVTARGRKIALTRVGDEVFAMRDACPHRAGPLSDGRVSTARLELICPWHFFRFDLRGGASITNPDLVNETYPVVIENGNVYVSIQRSA
jgi:nitrite reductase/ring-hydroxylating ferredoxin subunit